MVLDKYAQAQRQHVYRLTDQIGRLTLQLSRRNTDPRPDNQPPNRQVQGAQEPQCYNCGKVGHKSPACPENRKPHGNQYHVHHNDLAAQPRGNNPAVQQANHMAAQQYGNNLATQQHEPWVNGQYARQQQYQHTHPAQEYPARVDYGGNHYARGQAAMRLMSRVEAPAVHPQQNVLNTAGDRAAEHPVAEIYAGATPGCRPHVPFSPEAVSGRRPAGPNAAGRPAPRQQDPADMPTIPAGRSRFDIARHLANTPVKVDYLSLLRNAPAAQKSFIQELQQFDRDEANQGPRGMPQPNTAPAARAPAPFTPQQVQRARPAGPTHAAGPSNAAAPSNANQGVIPMEHMLETEEAYFADVPRSVNTAVKCCVTICGEPFEGILDTGATDSAISHTLIRRVGFMDRMTPSNVTFITAGGNTETPLGVMTNCTIRIGQLELKLDTMVTPTDSYNILVGNDWLRMAGADLLLSKGLLRIRLGIDSFEDVPIFVDYGLRRLNAFQADQRPIVLPEPYISPSPNSAEQAPTVLPEPFISRSSNSAEQGPTVLPDASTPPSTDSAQQGSTVLPEPFTTFSSDSAYSSSVPQVTKQLTPRPEDLAWRKFSRTAYHDSHCM